jgi:hypothetical protein
MAVTTSPNDPSLVPWRRGDPITASRLDTWQSRTVTTVRGGPGIRVLQKGGDVTVSLAPQDVRVRLGLFPVSLTVTAGQTDATHGGDDVTSPSYTYQMRTLDTDTDIGDAGQSPRVGREAGLFTAATEGEAYVKPDGTIGLWRAYETRIGETCGTP